MFIESRKHKNLLFFINNKYLTLFCSHSNVTAFVEKQSIEYLLCFLPSAAMVVPSRRTRPSRATPGFMLTQKISHLQTKCPKTIISMQKTSVRLSSFHHCPLVRWVWTECPTLGCSFMCRWSIFIYFDPQASAVLIGSLFAVIIFKLCPVCSRNIIPIWTSLKGT